MITARKAREFFSQIRSMFSLKMVTFCKDANCPSSQELLAYQTGEAAARERERIESHFAACEFCASEAEFYAHYPPPSEESVARVEIPLPLYELAEALLSDRHKDFLALNKLLCESEVLIK